MLLDQKKTKRIVRIVSIIAAIGFAGALLPILVLVILQSDGTSTADDTRAQIEAAQKLTVERPNDPVAWHDLAQELVDGDRASEAIAPARKAVALAPKDFRNTEVLVDALKADVTKAEEALRELQKFTVKNPTDTEALLSLGDLAAEQGKYALAKLSYQAVLTREPEGSPRADQALQSIALVDQTLAPTTAPATETAPDRTNTGPVTP